MSSDNNDICPEESVPQSDRSPGVVQDEEPLARIISSRTHLKNGSVSDDFFTVRDLLKRDGWSFVRLHYADNRQMRTFSERYTQEKPGREYVGYVQVQTAEVRKIKNDGKRALCVIDDAQENFREHALAQKSRPYNKGDARAIRKQLKDAVKLIPAQKSPAD